MQHAAGMHAGGQMRCAARNRNRCVACGTWSTLTTMLPLDVRMLGSAAAKAQPAKRGSVECEIEETSRKCTCLRDHHTGLAGKWRRAIDRVTSGD